MPASRVAAAEQGLDVVERRVVEERGLLARERLIVAPDAPGVDGVPEDAEESVLRPVGTHA